MDVLHLGGSRLGDRIADIIDACGDDPLSVDTLDDARKHLAERPEWVVSAGFRYILRADDLALAGDTVNVHTSFLPYGRGANPNVWAIVNGEPAGASLHRMEPEVDAGPLWAQVEVEMSFGDTAATIYRRVEDAAIDLFAARWPTIRDGGCEPVTQPPGGSHQYVRDMHALADISLEDRVTWRRALNVLRALTFPPHHNIVIDDGGRRWGVRLEIEELLG